MYYGDPIITKKPRIIQYRVYGRKGEVRVYNSIRQLEDGIIAEEIYVRLVDLMINGIIQHNYVDLKQLGQACGKGCRQAIELTLSN